MQGFGHLRYGSDGSLLGAALVALSLDIADKDFLAGRDQFARRKAVQLAQSLLAALFAAELPLDRNPIQLAFAVLEPGVGGGHGGVLQETLEVPIQQPFKAGR